MGYFCVDNLPLKLAPIFTDLVQKTRGGITQAALVIDIREGSFLNDLPEVIDDLRRRVPTVRILFFEARDDALIRRFSETRRPHPLAHSLPLPEAITREREILKGLRDRADLIIDTTQRNVHDLRRYLFDRFSSQDEAETLRVSVVSFGYKHGLPQDSDLVFDVRFLANPNFVDELRELDGRDPRVTAFLDRQPEYASFLERLHGMMEFLLPLYMREGKSYLAIAVGCTGGRHRSVAVAENIAAFLQARQLSVDVRHRDLGKP